MLTIEEVSAIEARCKAAEFGPTLEVAALITRDLPALIEDRKKMREALEQFKRHSLETCHRCDYCKEVALLIDAALSPNKPEQEVKDAPPS